MKILILDTETIGLEKCFCYNIGWVIRDTETLEILVKKDYVVKQFWENKPLFETAYYANKKQLYIKALRSRKATIKYWGFIMLDLIRDIEKYDIKLSYAFNSPFDSKVIDFNCDWFKCSNPLDYTSLIDIRALVNPIVFSKEYRNFCIGNNFLTESNNLKVNAEVIYRFITGKITFQEEHTALNDSIIESDILLWLNKNGIDITEPKKVYNIVKSGCEQTLKINYKGNMYEFHYQTKRTIKGVMILK